MGRRAFLAGLLAVTALSAAPPADARMHAPYRGHRIVPANAAPLDGFTSPSGAYSFRKLKSDYAGSAVRIRRASDNLELDIGFTASGDFNTTAATAHCAATTCFGRTWYDQSGSVRDLAQATTANQMELVFNCDGALPCWRATTNTQVFAGPSVTPATGVVSFSGVGNRSAGTGSCVWIRENGNANRLITQAVANAWQLVGGSSGTIAAAAADGAWHAAVGAVTGAATSYINVDGATTTGTATGTTTGAALAILGAATTTCLFGESVFWDNYTLTSGEASALIQNQRNYWMPAPLDSFTTPSGAYSFRKLRSAYAGPAIRIRRASDNAELDINFLGFVPGLGAPWDEAAANAHCVSTSCFVRTMYDQSGNGRDLIQATPANQPNLVFNCRGALPCLAASSGSITLLTAASITPATGVVSLNVVANRSAGTGLCNLIRENGANNRIVTQGAGVNWQSGTLLAPAADVMWHSGISVLNGASSGLTIDGVTTTGSTTGNTTAGTAGLQGVASTTCQESELLLWDNVVLSAGEIAVLTANQRSYGLIP